MYCINVFDHDQGSWPDLLDWWALNIDVTSTKYLTQFRKLLTMATNCLQYY